MTIVANLLMVERSLDAADRLAAGGVSAEVLAQVAERALDSLDGVCRVTGAPTPVPYSPSLEERWLPSPERIASPARRLVRGGEA